MAFLYLQGVSAPGILVPGLEMQTEEVGPASGSHPGVWPGLGTLAEESERSGPGAQLVGSVPGRRVEVVVALEGADSGHLEPL